MFRAVVVSVHIHLVITSASSHLYGPLRWLLWSGPGVCLWWSCQVSEWNILEDLLEDGRSSVTWCLEHVCVYYSSWALVYLFPSVLPGPDFGVLYDWVRQLDREVIGSLCTSLWPSRHLLQSLSIAAFLFSDGLRLILNLLQKNSFFLCVGSSQIMQPTVFTCNKTEAWRLTILLSLLLLSLVFSFTGSPTSRG